MRRILTSQEIGSNLRFMRQRAGITQEQLAERIGVSAFQIRKYEAGRNTISLEKLQLFADALSVQIQDFFSQDQETLPLEPAEGFLLEAYRAIPSSKARRSILDIVIYAASVNKQRNKD